MFSTQLRMHALAAFATIVLAAPGVMLAQESLPIPTITPDAKETEGVYQIRYFANLNAGESVINLTNAGTLSSPNDRGSICVNAYAFDPAEELISCCSCYVAPNGLASLSVRNDLISNTLTGGVPTSITVKLLSTLPNAMGGCVAGADYPLVRGMRAWGTTLHKYAPVVGATNPPRYDLVETEFAKVELATTEHTKLTGFCGFINAIGGGYGICKSCRATGLGAEAR